MDNKSKAWAYHLGQKMRADEPSYKVGSWRAKCPFSETYPMYQRFWRFGWNHKLFEYLTALKEEG